MLVSCQLGVHVLYKIEEIAHDLKDVHSARPNPVFRSLQTLALIGDALAQALDSFVHVAPHRGVVLLADYQVQVTARRLVQVMNGCQTRRTSRQQLERPQGLDLLHAPTDSVE